MITRRERVLLDRLAARAWPPLEQTELDGWLLRAAHGVTKRANSALPVDADASAIDEVLPEIHDYYVARGLPVLAQVSDPAIDAALDARGWSREFETTILTGAVSTGGTGVEVTDVPSGAWLTCWWSVDGRGGDAELDVARRIMASSAGLVGHASVRVAGEVVAVARGVVEDGWLGVFSMAVRPHARRQGHASAVLRGLGDWATQHGAGSTYLQVAAGNVPALRLYERSGLAPAYSYAYRSGNPARAVGV